MANNTVRTIARSFAAGEITPELYARADLVQYQTGLRTCRNFFTVPHGPAKNRSGFEFVAEVRSSGNQTRLIPFAYSSDQTMVLAFSPGTIRFYTNGAALLEAAATLSGSGAAFTSPATYAVGDEVFVSGTGDNLLDNRFLRIGTASGNTYSLTDKAGGALSVSVAVTGTIARVYQVATPYAEADLFNLHYTQSNDVLTIVHPSYPQYELRRLGVVNWTMTTISFGAVVAPPSAPSAVATYSDAGGATGTLYEYVVTSINSDTKEESAASVIASCYNKLYVETNYNTISWNAVAGVQYYRVYRRSAGVFAYIGQTTDLTLIDDYITPDGTTTPPIYSAYFSGANEYPAAVCYYEQRRAFAGTYDHPQRFYLTRPGTESNMAQSIPSQDDDAIDYQIAARQGNAIRHLVPLSKLVVLTGSAEWAISAADGGALTVSTVKAAIQTYNGASNVQPVVVNYSMLYAASRGGHMREMVYSNDSGGYVTNDVSILAPHLFDYLTITDMAFSAAPWPIVWCVSSNGDLIGMTYSPEQKVTAWHHHDTDGAFESVCCVTEGSEDILYAVVRRVVGGRSVRYVERMHTRQIQSLSDSFFVDAGTIYNGAATTTIGNLWHLEGKTVSVLADGAVMPQQIVASGSITLPIAASIVAVGLPITGDIQTLPLSYDGEANGSGRRKNVKTVWARVNDSTGINAGPDVGNLTQYKQRTVEPYGTPPALVSAEVEIAITPQWNPDASVWIRQSDPLPLTVSAITLETIVGG